VLILMPQTVTLPTEADFRITASSQSLPTKKDQQKAENTNGNYHCDSVEVLQTKLKQTAQNGYWNIFREYLAKNGDKLPRISFEAVIHGKLQSIQLQNTILKKANFKNADCTGANFENADCIGANFENANCTEADFIGAVLDDASFDNTILSGAKFFDSEGLNKFFATVLEDDATFGQLKKIHQQFRTQNTEAEQPESKVCIETLLFLQKVDRILLSAYPMTYQQVAQLESLQQQGTTDDVKSLFLTRVLNELPRALSNPDTAVANNRVVSRFGSRCFFSSGVGFLGVAVGLAYLGATAGGGMLIAASIASGVPGVVLCCIAAILSYKKLRKYNGSSSGSVNNQGGGVVSAMSRAELARTEFQVSFAPSA
jgi:hypothetical protein